MQVPIATKLKIVGEILQNALDSNPHQDAQSLNLLSILNSYEKVLSKYNIKPEQDLFYYRFLLQLNMDPDKNWFSKLKKHQKVLINSNNINESEIRHDIDINESKYERNDDMDISKSCSPKISHFTFSKYNNNNDLQNEYYTQWNDNYTPQNTQIKHEQSVSRRNQFVDMLEAALEPKKRAQRKIMEVWKTFVADNKIIYIGHNVAMSKAETHFEDESMIKCIRKWFKYTKKRKKSRSKNMKADNFYDIHMEKRIVCRWQLYVKYAKRYRKCLKRTKQWYLHRLIKQCFNSWYRQYLYYNELHIQSKIHFNKKYKRKIINEWRNILKINNKINDLRQRQCFIKWLHIVKKNRIPILNKPSQINAICIWTQNSFNCNIINVIHKMNKYSNNRNEILTSKQISNKIQNEYNLVWKPTRINQLNQMIAVHEKYYGLILRFRNWRKYTQNVKKIKFKYFRIWKYVITNWKHQRIIAQKYERRNLLKTAFETWKIRYIKLRKLEYFEGKITRARNRRLIKKYSSIWTLNLLSILFHKNKLKTRIIRQWKMVIKQQKIESIMEQQSVLYRRRFLLFEGLNGWIKYVKIQKQNRKHSLNAELFRHSHLISKMLNQWKKSKRILDHVRMKYYDIVVRNENKMMSKSFKIWYRLHIFRKKLRNDMEISEWYHRVQVLSHSICYWKYYIGIKRKKRENEINALVFNEHITKNRAYKCWKEFIAIKQNQLTLSIQYEIHLERKLIIKSFVNWQQSFQRIKMYEYVDEYCINKTLKTFMLRWKIGSEIENKTNELKIESFRNKYDIIKHKQMKIYCFNIWIESYERNIDLQTKVCQFQTKKDIKRIELCFDIWREITKQNKNFKQICYECSTQLNHSQILYFINNWRNYVCRKNELFEKQEIITTNHRINTIKSLIINWKTIVIAKNDKYDFLNHCYDKIIKTQIWKYFEKWQISLNYKQQYTQLILIHKYRNTKHYFNKWFNCNQYIIQQRQIGCKLRAMNQKSVMIKCMSIWKAEFVRITNTKTGIMNLKHVQKQYILCCFVNKWKDYTYIEQRKKKAHNMYKISMCRKVLNHWDNFLDIKTKTKRYKLYFNKFQMNHIIRNHFNQWRYQFNLIQIEQKLNAKFQHQRVLNIFINWKSKSENMINLRNKGKYYYDERCIQIKSYYFVLWDNLYQIEQSKKSHIQQWIMNKKQKRCLLYLYKWKNIAMKRQQYDTQMTKAKKYFRRKLLSNGLQIFKDNYLLQDKIDKMYDDAIYFNIQSTRQYVLSVWLQFIALQRKNTNLHAIGIEFKMYINIALWRNMCSRNNKLRLLEFKLYQQSQQYLVSYTFKSWKTLWNNIQKSKRFRNKSLSIKCLKIWRKVCIYKQIEVRKIVKCIQITIINRFYMKWNNVLQHRQHLFQIAMSCHKRRQFNLMKECYMEWNIQIILQSKCKHIIDRNAKKNVFIIFHNWFNQSYSSQLNRKAITHYNIKNVKMAWNEWKNRLILYQMNQTQALKHYQKKIRPKILIHNLLLWKTQTQKYKSTKIMISIIDNHWNNQHITLTLQKWTIFSKSQSRLKSIANSITSKHNINEKNNIFIEWRYQCMIVKHIKHISKIKNTQIIKNHLIAWKVFSNQEKALHAKTTFIRMELRAIPQTKLLCEYKLGNIWKRVRSPIFKHFLSWKIHTQQIKKIEKDQQIAKSHHQMAIYVHCFSQWQNIFNHAKLLHKAFDYHRKYLLKIVLTEWKLNHLRRCNNEQLLMKAYEFNNKQILMREINLWSEYNQHNKNLQKKELILTKIIHNKKMSFVFLLWLTKASKLQLHRNQTWKSYEFRANTLKRQFFVIWLQQYAIHSSLRDRELEFRNVSNYKLIYDTFYKWCNTYNGVIYKADLLENHFNEICNYRLAKYFTLWFSVYNCSKHTRERYLLSKIFTKWKHVTKRRNQFKKEIVHKPYIVYQ